MRTMFVGMVVAVSLAAQHPETQVVILENTLVRVLEIRVSPGVFEPTHSHARGVTVALSDYDNETKSVPEGKVGVGHTRFGEVKWAEPVTHEARNTGKTEQHVIRIELKGDARGVVGLTVAGVVEGQKLLFDNAYVRAVEDNGVPAKHSHQRSVVVDLAGGVRWSEPVVHEGGAGRVIWIEVK